ncbi:BBP7 family outer membrane beta-barrel protein [Candidatus Laterigemmans baculatus]|uniref:BBP7 family outer membrane beta-barrel protein n=1 Tax=Candidatus Laterigemmans baculatus TaxID=2770505 RepID=UPI0013D9B2E4|nr:BBP7 family outer membrane beta-barrel protein [Candidatus Laterigemmans baculatus]
MNPRLVFLLITAVSAGFSVSPAVAQQLAPYPAGGPMMMPPPGTCDPYARPNFPVWGAPVPPPLAPIAAPLPLAERFWFRGEYLRWWTKGMEAPPLVTSSPAGTPQNEAGVLGFPDTSVLFGGGELNDDAANGMRFRTGFWMTPHQSLGIEGEYFELFTQEDNFAASSDGSVILARPFFDTNNDRETAQLVAFPGLVAGDIGVTSESDLQSILINARVALNSASTAAYPTLYPPNRVDWIVGYRYLELSDQLSIVEDLESLGPPVGTIASSESFSTSNEFHGVQLGVLHQANMNRLWLESMLRVAIGNNTQNVRVQGTTVITEGGVPETYEGNLLAQRTNIGSRERSELTMIPEVGVTLGLRITERLHATVGYSILYFPNVVRAGEQIDRDVNPNLIPPEVVPFSGALRPEPLFDETDYWAHGLNLGGEFRF